MLKTKDTLEEESKLLHAEKVDGGLHSNKGWRHERIANSLPESFMSVKVPVNGSFWKKLLAFAGPGLMVAVGYMDPGNWATDIAGGARFGYTLISVILISNIFAMVLQHLAVK